ncbi:MAG: hypothetical protein H6577_08680 [Lewinellaceae bacterium]|nr:hypothetical protein [Saprospiraceae bacterium]MCB9338187.1 hypothetical protein [Lewinellaceae bacterium]
MNIAEKYTNLEYLYLMADGDQDMVQTILLMLLEELPEEFEKIKMLNSERNWEELSKVSHKMKSTLTFVGNEEMTNANKAIEDCSKNNMDTHLIESYIRDIEDKIPKVVEELKQKIAPNG